MGPAKKIQPRRALGNYWDDSSRPLVSLAFVAPMLIAYEGGLLLLGPKAMRNGADVWLRHLLEGVGFGQYFLLPILACGLLLGWHHLNHDRWRFSTTVLYGMLVESMLLGIVLLALAYVQGSLFISLSLHTCSLPDGPAAWGRLVAFFGAGIYEELLFRLMLLPAVAAVLRLAGLQRGSSLAIAVILTSLLFAAAHYRLDLALGPIELATSFGETFEWMSFLFRFLAGLFFSLLFLCRGFGIAAGTHALYDVLAFMI